jgi:hypothetical protein
VPTRTPDRGIMWEMPSTRRSSEIARRLLLLAVIALALGLGGVGGIVFGDGSRSWRTALEMLLVVGATIPIVWLFQRFFDLDDATGTIRRRRRS